MRSFLTLFLLTLAAVAHAQTQINPAPQTPATPDAVSTTTPTSASIVAQQQETFFIAKLHPHSLRFPTAKAGTETDLRGVISNATATPLTITSLTTDAATQVIFLQQQKDPASGITGLLPVPAMTLPAHGVLTFDDQHKIRLMGLTKDLEAGMEVPLTAHFTHGSTRTFRAVILN